MDTVGYATFATITTLSGDFGLGGVGDAAIIALSQFAAPPMGGEAAFLSSQSAFSGAGTIGIVVDGKFSTIATFHAATGDGASGSMAASTLAAFAGGFAEGAVGALNVKTLPVLLFGSAASGNSGGLAVHTAVALFVGNAATGGVGSGAFNGAMAGFGGDAVFGGVGTLSFTSSPADFGGFTITPSAVAAVFSALSMDAKTSGVALYANFPVTSMFKLGLKYYGITSAGIVLLSGSSDNGADIDALIVSPVSNLGMDEKKNLPAVYLTMRCEGDLEVAVIYDERKRILKAGSSSKSGLSDIRFPLPLGIDGNRVQIEIRNVDGADFDMKEAQAVIVKRDRRR